jgi:hypothetical protein
VQYHEVKVNIDFETKANLSKTLTGPTDDIKDASLWVDYIFLDTDERRRFAQLSHEYLIEQLQFTGAETFTANGVTQPRIKLNFNHPCKELIWVVQRDSVFQASASNAWTNYSHADGANMVDRAKIQLNGHDRFAERPGDVFNLVQPFQHHENVPTNTGINVYSFALKPEEHQPSGTLNMSRIDTAVLAMTTKSFTGSAQVKVYAVNYNVKILGIEKLPAKRKWALLLGKSVRSPQKRSVASLAWNPSQARHLVVREHPYSLIYQRCDGNTHPAKNNELGYGNNDKDWATRMLITYRLFQPKVRRQRLNGCRLVGNITHRLKIQSRPVGKLTGQSASASCPVWAVSLTPTKRTNYYQILIQSKKINKNNFFQRCIFNNNTNLASIESLYLIALHELHGECNLC